MKLKSYEIPKKTHTQKHSQTPNKLTNSPRKKTLDLIFNSGVTAPFQKLRQKILENLTFSPFIYFLLKITPCTVNFYPL